MTNAVNLVLSSIFCFTNGLAVVCDISKTFFGLYEVAVVPSALVYWSPGSNIIMLFCPLFIDAPISFQSE